MADGISSIANAQLTVLQMPEVAREETPVLLQSQIITSQAPGIIRHLDQQAAESVQVLQKASWRNTPDALSQNPARGRPSYREPGPRNLHNKVIALAAAHPRGLGRMVDVLA